MTYEKNDNVEWEWGKGKAFGTVKEVFTEDVARTINGTKVKREASASSPAYLIEQIDGDSQVLKSHSEVTKVSKETVYEYAQEKGIEGRSDMTKDELLSAVTK